MLEGLDVALEELRHFLDSESSNVGTVSDSLDGELLELEDIIVLVLQLVKVDSVVLNTPCDLFLGLLDLTFVSLVKDLEEFWVNLEIILSDMKVLLGSGILLYNLVEGLSQVINLNSDLLFLPICESQSMIFLSSKL